MSVTLSPELRFDEAGHRYTADGERVVSVTTLLAGLGLVDGRFFSDAAATRGTAVHAAIQMNDEDDLDESSLSPVVATRLGGWRRFREETGYVPLSDRFGARGVFSEVRMLSKRLRVAGTADSIGTMRGVVGLVLLDAKTGVPNPATALQTAGYSVLFHELTGEVIARRFAVHLDEAGGYALIPYVSPKDSLRFVAACDLYRWRLENLPALVAVEEAA